MCVCVRACELAPNQSVSWLVHLLAGRGGISTRTVLGCGESAQKLSEVMMLLEVGCTKADLRTGGSGSVEESRTGA